MATNVKIKRSILKSITFRILIILSDLVVVFAFTRRADITFGLVVSTNLASTLFYFIHERIWNKIQWGRS
ncbi:MAG: DUF2061 domain-containing protein [Candidatus Paceibacterota bacterium]